MIRAIIIDDEPKAREVLAALLEEYFPEVEVLASEGSLENGIEAISKFRPELVFLDIEMPGQNGFKLFDYFEKVDFEVIFTTAYDSYALKAIKVSALDYLLKPISINDLQKALEKFHTRRDKAGENKVKVHESNSNATNVPGEIKQLALPTLEGFFVVDAENVMYAVADGSYTIFHLNNKEKVMVSRSLKEYEELLAGSRFFRVHNSFLINLRHVRKYFKGKTGYVELTDGSTIEVAVRRKDDFLKALGKL